MPWFLLDDRSPPLTTHLRRAPQRIGCEHPTPQRTTMITDRSTRWLCVGCEADWMELKRR